MRWQVNDGQSQLPFRLEKHSSFSASDVATLSGLQNKTSKQARVRIGQVRKAKELESLVAVMAFAFA